MSSILSPMYFVTAMPNNHRVSKTAVALDVLQCLNQFVVAATDDWLLEPVIKPINLNLCCLCRAFHPCMKLAKMRQE
jgi:hypothetical protein